MKRVQRVTIDVEFDSSRESAPCQWAWAAMFPGREAELIAWEPVPSDEMTFTVKVKVAPNGLRPTAGDIEDALEAELGYIDEAQAEEMALTVGHG